jgi:hypothetical protein
LSFLLLALVFWGINIAAAVFPIFIGSGSLRNILIAGITSQVITRALIGIWAVEEQSLKKDATTSKKVSAFILAIIPIAAIPSFLQAARTAIRKDRISNLTIASISAVIIMSILLFGTREGLTDLTTWGSSTPDPNATVDPAVAALYENVTIEPTELPPTATPRVYRGGCRNPSSIAQDEVGDVVEVCGKVTNYGDIDCEACPLGFYSFIKLDSEFQIVSYDWRFSFAWLGDCMRVSDEVSLLGEEPVFVFDKGEGYAGTECITDAQGELVCDGGFYFQDYFECENR